MRLYPRELVESWPELDAAVHGTRRLVVFHCQDPPGGAYPWKDGDVVLFLGDVEGMAGHGIFVSKKTGQTHFGYHNDNFRVIPDDEL